MTGFKLSRQAFLDLNEITQQLTYRDGYAAADELEESLLAACQTVAENPGIGHRRQDLTSRPLLFYFDDPYFVIYAQHTDPLGVVAILHSSRNIRRILRSRRAV